MVQAVRVIGQCFDCKKMLLISNENKLPPLNRRICKKSSDYNQMWLKLGATRRKDGDYEVPCFNDADATHSSSAMASLLHIETSHRNQLRDSILTEIHARLTAEKTSTGYMYANAPFTSKIKNEVLRD